MIKQIGLDGIERRFLEIEQSVNGFFRAPSNQHLHLLCGAAKAGTPQQVTGLIKAEVTFFNWAC